jgi:hypothetical protein
MTTIVHSVINKENKSTTGAYINKQRIQSSSNTISDITFSDDDDSTCSFDSLMDDKLLLTPPLEETIEEQVDWGKQKALFICTELIGFLLEFWSKVISNFNQFSQSETKHLSTQIVQHGIPSALRGTVWPLLTKTGGDEGLQDVYIELLKQESVYEKAITRDLHRTFPHHPYFQSYQGQESLFNVVKAYSLYDPEVGYCQGLAFVAGPLLLNVNRI